MESSREKWDGYWATSALTGITANNGTGQKPMAATSSSPLPPWDSNRPCSALVRLLQAGCLVSCMNKNKVKLANDGTIPSTAPCYSAAATTSAATAINTTATRAATATTAATAHATAGLHLASPPSSLELGCGSGASAVYMVCTVVIS